MISRVAGGKAATACRKGAQGPPSLQAALPGGGRSRLARSLLSGFVSEEGAGVRGQPPMGWAFRLRGEVGGEVKYFDVPAGTVSVGAAADNALVVPLASVSRRHAALHVRDGIVTVQDLDSKNGTYINGLRVSQGLLQPGDWVAFGPSQFQLERIDPTDTQLAIAFDHSVAAGDGVTLTEISTEAAPRGEQHRPGAWMMALSNLGNVLLGEFDPRPGDALALLAEGVGARGVLFFRWEHKGEPIAVASWGEEIVPERCANLRRSVIRAADAASIEPVLVTGRDSEPAAIWAVLARPQESPLGVVLHGGFAHWEQAEPLAEVVLRMLVHAQPEAIHVTVGGKLSTPPTLVFPEGHVIGRSPSMVAVYEELRLLVGGDLPVLVVGETGVGKEHVARTLHLSCTRSCKPFVAVNCAAIPADLLEAELFGIEKGVATGVVAREGKFSQAHGGVLVLDEVAEMPLSLQAKLLRALQEGEISPLGARLPVKVNARVVAMTNTDLQARVREGKFRKDLYYRLNGYRLWVPPLRQRREDIPLMVEHFLRRFAIEVGKPLRGVSVKALRALVQAPWEGNVRELEHEVRRLVYLCQPGQTIDSSLLSPEMLHPIPAHDPRELDKATDLTLERQVEALERRLITIALARTKGNRSRAAKLLGISRNGLALKIDRFGMESA